MNRNTIENAISQISDRHILEAAKPRKRRPYWLGAVAAVLAVALLIGVFAAQPFSSTAPTIIDPPGPLIINPKYPIMLQNPYLLNNLSPNLNSLAAWRADQQQMHTQPDGYADNLDRFFRKLLPALLSQKNTNTVCSPVNIYMALAILAETANGSSRQQILSLLQEESIAHLRAEVNDIWRGHYNNDGITTSILANALFLDDHLSWHPQTVKQLADSYYASVYQGDLGSAEMDAAIHSWLDQETGGLLSNQAAQIQLPPETILYLASTIYYQTLWIDKFFESYNTEAPFYTPDGPVSTTFMNFREHVCYEYYFGYDFGAIFLPLEGNGGMWLFLPDAGKTPQDLFNSGSLVDFILSEQSRNSATVRLKLSVPKFDVSSNLELKECLQALGIGDIFEPETADFSALLSQNVAGYVDQVSHAARVSIDENGVTGAAYVDIRYYTSLAPPEEIVDFVLDRPFVFVIESEDGLPLFAGTVYEPQ